MALSLYRGANTEEVLRVVTEGMDYLGAAAIRREVGKSAISASRTRLGAEVMHYLSERALAPRFSLKQKALFIAACGLCAGGLFGVALGEY